MVLQTKGEYDGRGTNVKGEVTQVNYGLSFRRVFYQISGGQVSVLRVYLSTLTLSGRGHIRSGRSQYRVLTRSDDVLVWTEIDQWILTNSSYSDQLGLKYLRNYIFV